MLWKQAERLAKQKWILSGDDTFLNALLRTKGGSADVVDRQIKRILRHERFHRAVDPWVVLLSGSFKLLWEKTYGQYRRTRQAIHGSAAAPTAGSAGTVGVASPGFTPPYGQPFEDAGIRAGEVVAYRCWLLQGGFLYSAYREGFIWKPDETAEGDPLNFMEGVHGFKTRLDACTYMGLHELAGDPAHILVSGTVDLWGDVYEHERGYRASKGRVASIDDSPNYDAASLRELYKLTSLPKPQRRKK